jgi:ubiquitin-protein ligase
MASITASLLQKRLLQDISELQTKPYPGIALHIQDDLKQACLILSRETAAPLHLTINFRERYPLQPPEITIQSKITHPNIYGDYICASILNTKEGYTSAYTLKGICIQLLSFFGSDRIEQEYGGLVSLEQYASTHLPKRPGIGYPEVQDGFVCNNCGFGQPDGHVMGSGEIEATDAANHVRYRYSSSSDTKSTLTHASEKAVESYYQLYHLLVTLATDDPSIAEKATAWVKAFKNGNRTKTSFPNLGYLLVAMLIADAETTSDLTSAVIAEAISRNVVWMLDDRGAGMAGLSYIEPSEISEFRLAKTYEASKTSYNLLMFVHLMRKTVTKPPKDADGSKPRTLRDIRDELFSRHGAPPAETAAEPAASIRRIQQVKSFPGFLQVMDTPAPTKASFTRFLQRSLQDSVDKGYSAWALTRGEALTMRLRDEIEVEVAESMRPSPLTGRRVTFFPQNHKRKQDGSGEHTVKGGRVRGRGRGMWR